MRFQHFIPQLFSNKKSVPCKSEIFADYKDVQSKAHILAHKSDANFAISSKALLELRTGPNPSPDSSATSILFHNHPAEQYRQQGKPAADHLSQQWKQCREAGRMTPHHCPGQVTRSSIKKITVRRIVLQIPIC